MEITDPAVAPFRQHTEFIRNELSALHAVLDQIDDAILLLVIDNATAGTVHPNDHLRHQRDLCLFTNAALGKLHTITALNATLPTAGQAQTMAFLQVQLDGFADVLTLH